LVFSAVPVMVMLVLGAQKHVGNENVAMVAVALRRQNVVIYVLWSLIALGSMVAIPAAILDGAFRDASTTDAAPRQDVDIGPSQGMLVAKPGMTFDQMRQASSLPIAATGQRTATGAIESGVVFDFTVAGTGIRFERCRYYFISAYTHDPERIEAISIGTSAAKMTLAALNQANADVRGKLANDGWLTGHEEYKTEDDQTLHGGATRGPEGDIWLKDETVLHIESKRMDDPVPGEDASTAGEWIQTISLWQRQDYPWIERYAFAPPSPEPKR
jgi:hypothetical protein